MKKMLCLAIVLVSIVAMTPASAQSFGELFPLTNTRYGAAHGTPRLAANGRDFFLFWSTERQIRATSLAHSTPQLGHVVLDTNAKFDVAWNGEEFLAASSRAVNEYSNDANIIGRLLDAEAQPLGGEFLIAEHGREPRIAAGPEAMVVVYRGTAGDTRVLVRGPHGESTGTESWALPMGISGYAVATNGAGFVVAYAKAKETNTIGLDRQGRKVSEDALAYPFGAVSYREVALATDGKRYLLAWSAQTAGGKGAMLLDENGSFVSPLTIGGGFSRSLSAVWTGSDWRMSWESKQGDGQLRARFLNLDRDVTRWSAEEESNSGGVVNPSMAAIGERVMVAWSLAGQPGSPSPGGPALVVEMPLATHQPRVATYEARQQTLLATASSADARLVIWTEQDVNGTSIHSGFHRNDGQWTERVLPADGFPATAAAAASDGTGFVVVITGGGTQKMLRLDARGRSVIFPVSLPGLRTAIAWNGSRYAIITAGPDLEGMLLDPSTGVLSKPAKIPYDPAGSPFNGKLSLASNGEGFLLAGETAECQFAVCGARAMKAMRLGADLKRVEADEITLDSVYGELAGAVWNGSEYVVAWRGVSDLLVSARVPAAAAAPIRIASADANIIARSIAPMPDGTVAVAGPARTSSATRVAFLRNDGSVAQSVDIDSATLNGTPLLATVPGGVAYVASSVQEAAPHHGSSHVMMAIARPSLPPPPGAPLVQARLDKGVIQIDWSAPAGTVNGYRIEVRADGGAWNEIEEWFSPGSPQKAITPPSGTELAVRMRAFNDGGASDYATAAVSKPTRRRAVR
jgi:hypothetical protein